ncbi:MAG TPA: GNAT family N-acetyltransferase [Clostridiaceae bacterium]|nr:GNAT family N-acetyltransferase [Clostridiaceae bacterium]
MIHFETKRTLARDFVLDDFQDLHDILSDPLVMEHAEPAYSEEQTLRFLEDFCIAKQAGFAVVLKAENKVIGYVLFSDQLEKDVYEVGWFFNRRYWRQGFAYEALSDLFAYAFHQRHACKLFAETIDDVKSASLMVKLGMSLENVQKQHVQDHYGAWRDLYHFSLLREDYKMENDYEN